MPWDTIKLNDGRSIPSLAFGTGSLGNGQSTIDTVKQALGTGLIHIDTAQGYKNEQETGTALQQSGLKRDELYITTKFSGAADIDIATSIRNSVNWLGVEYVDLYLIHSPRFAKPDISSAWKQLEKAQADGLTKSIGVSNFTVPDLKELLASAQVKPAANQIQLHPYVWAKQAPIVEFCQNNGIVVEAYSALIPLRRHQGGPVDVPVNKIAKRLNAAPEQVLLAWAKAKGAVVITASRKKERLEGYLKAGDLELTADDVAAIDDAGKDGPPPSH